MQIKSQVHRQVKINKVKCAKIAKYNSRKNERESVQTHTKHSRKKTQQNSRQPNEKRKRERTAVYATDTVAFR